MEPILLGWPAEGPTLRLDYREFSYAGKFVMSNTGKAVVRNPEPASDNKNDEFDRGILAAVAFNEDRTDPSTLWLRYVTVKRDRRGEGFGPKLCRFVADRASDRGYDRLRIAVNNPFAYEALYRSGFGYTGEQTGIAELVLERPAARPVADRSEDAYQEGLDEYRSRDLSGDEHAFLADKRGCEPPSIE